MENTERLVDVKAVNLNQAVWQVELLFTYFTPVLENRGAFQNLHLLFEELLRRHSYVFLADEALYFSVELLVTVFRYTFEADVLALADFVGKEYIWVLLLFTMLAFFL